MSTESLLPSYASAARRRDQRVITYAAPVIQTGSLIIFASAAIASTGWAYQSFAHKDLSPVPLLPYFAALCLVVSFGCWAGYLFFISYDAVGGPRIQRKIIIWTSVIGKLILAGTHYVLRLSYKNFFPELAHPNWVVAFLAAQAWWDLLLFLVFSRLRAS
ncbi:uncharacterized protein K441DRAFT_610495 [Cenococcum geophilum 1.58]|uniref:uncharacterized protein n=1 Tax=Cenococcum geophilum 1.58 TaxID=794803 RepID=UPI00358E53E7|nr:hypothetical protein K441DRAFT_610495 [Cenococcum geophilum 1.58]